ncbi:MAG TPA: hypothetical protein VF389_09240, partial [Woeseiaceae bacterium]
MLDEQEPQNVRDAGVVLQVAATARPGIDELVAGLAERRVSMRRVSCAAGTTAGGVTLPVPVGTLRQSFMATEQLMRHVTMLASEAVPVNLA